MLCPCHGEPMQWWRDQRRSAGGSWRCAVKERNRNIEGRRERQLRYWHKANGGYVVRRRRHLADQRAELVRRLHDIEQEASRC